jgi:hypothetical protein
LIRDAYNNLGTAMAVRGRIDEAIRYCQKALELATQQNHAAVAEQLRARLRHYESLPPRRFPAT